MSTKPSFPDPAQAGNIADEADIGSGEKSRSQIETEEMIRQIPPLPPAGQEEAGDDANDNNAAAANNFDAGATRERGEHAHSLERDEPGEDLDNLDPVPPEGR